MATQNKLNHTKYAKLIKLLMIEPRTPHELAEAVKMHIVNVQGLMRILKKHKVVHVCDWGRNSRGIDTTPVYKFGTGRHKPRRKMTAAERSARYREKKKMLALQNILHKESA